MTSDFSSAGEGCATMTGRPLALGHLTLLHVPPPELVRIAAAAGFDLVGPLRLTPARDGTGHPMLGNAPMRRETVRMLGDIGVGVLDVEVVRVRPGFQVEEALPLLEAGQELGARFLLTTVEDPEPARAAESFAILAATAAPYGLRCVVEPMVFSVLRTVPDALRLLRDAAAPGAAVLVDALHLARGGGTPAVLDGVDSALLPYVQLCDAATDGPAEDVRAAAQEALTERLPPGEGVLPLAQLVRHLAPDAPLSCEVPNPAARADPAGWAARVARGATSLR